MNGDKAFVFQREQPAPTAERIGEMAAECKAIIPKLEELGALLCLTGNVGEASRLMHATMLLIRELRVASRRD